MASKPSTSMQEELNKPQNFLRIQQSRQVKGNPVTPVFKPPSPLPKKKRKPKTPKGGKGCRKEANSQAKQVRGTKVTPKTKVLKLTFGKTVNKTVVKTVNKTVGKTVGKTVNKTVGKTVGKTVNKTVGKTIGKTVGKTVENVPALIQASEKVSNKGKRKGAVNNTPEIIPKRKRNQKEKLSTSRIVSHVSGKRKRSESPTITHKLKLLKKRKLQKNKQKKTSYQIKSKKKKLSQKKAKKKSSQKKAKKKNKEKKRKKDIQKKKQQSSGHIFKKRTIKEIQKTHLFTFCNMEKLLSLFPDATKYESWAKRRDQWCSTDDLWRYAEEMINLEEELGSIFTNFEDDLLHQQYELECALDEYFEYAHKIKKEYHPQYKTENTYSVPWLKMHRSFPLHGHFKKQSSISRPFAASPSETSDEYLGQEYTSEYLTVDENAAAFWNCIKKACNPTLSQPQKMLNCLDQSRREIYIDRDKSRSLLKDGIEKWLYTSKTGKLYEGSAIQENKGTVTGFSKSICENIFLNRNVLESFEMLVAEIMKNPEPPFPLLQYDCEPKKKFLPDDAYELNLYEAVEAPYRPNFINSLELSNNIKEELQYGNDLIQAPDSFDPVRKYRVTINITKKLGKLSSELEEVTSKNQEKINEVIEQYKDEVKRNVLKTKLNKATKEMKDPLGDLVKSDFCLLSADANELQISQPTNHYDPYNGMSVQCIAKLTYDDWKKLYDIYSKHHKKETCIDLLCIRPSCIQANRSRWVDFDDPKYYESGYCFRLPWIKKITFCDIYNDIRHKRKSLHKSTFNEIEKNRKKKETPIRRNQQAEIKQLEIKLKTLKAQYTELIKKPYCFNPENKELDSLS